MDVGAGHATQTVVAARVGIRQLFELQCALNGLGQLAGVHTRQYVEDVFGGSALRVLAIVSACQRRDVRIMTYGDLSEQNLA